MNCLTRASRHVHFKMELCFWNFIWRFAFLSIFSSVTFIGPLIFFGLIPLEATHHIPHINIFTVIAQLAFYLFTFVMPLRLKVKKVIFCYRNNGFPLLRLRYLLPLYAWQVLLTCLVVYVY